MREERKDTGVAMSQPGKAATILLVLWIIMNPLIFFLVSVSPALGFAGYLPPFVFHVHDVLMGFFSADAIP